VKHELKKAFLFGLLTSLSMAALMAIVIFIVGNMGETEGHILMTTLVMGIYCLTGLCQSTLLGRGRLSILAGVGLLLSVVGFIATTQFIWEGGWGILDHFKAILILAILAFSTAHASLLLSSLWPGKGPVRASLAATLAFIGAVTILLVVLIVKEYRLNEFSPFFRALGVFSILDVLGTIVTPILKKTQAPKSEPASGQSPENGPS
jgi:hypothetical protein